MFLVLVCPSMILSFADTVLHVNLCTHSRSPQVVQDGSRFYKRFILKQAHPRGNIVEPSMHTQHYDAAHHSTIHFQSPKDNVSSCIAMYLELTIKSSRTDRHTYTLTASIQLFRNRFGAQLIITFKTHGLICWYAE